MEQSEYAMTPKRLSDCAAITTLISTPKNIVRQMLLSNNQSFSPSPSVSSKKIVRNPFENHLYERLHMSVISSPVSMFQTLTPTRQFEWTIEDLSELHPVNLVPCETQFSDELDPAREAHAQAAIRSFFAEDQKIVPSPEVCILRQHKIILKDENIFANSTASTLSPQQEDCMKTACDAVMQTALTFPPQLPREVEDLLKKYHFYDDDRCDPNYETDAQLESTRQSNEMMDISTLRRKLFINCLESPESDESLHRESNDVQLSPALGSPHFLVNRMNGSMGDGEVEVPLFGDFSPIEVSSPSAKNDVSMASEYGHGKTPTSAQLCKKLKKGKNLSESFCLLESGNHVEEVNIEQPRFGRSDSGFSADENSKFSEDFMQL